ncbi:unnamed protein product [Ilex paraguariensis]|uniref:Anaphase-promoting complex subunit 4-like WD40 domain-containing protein n=1 Tax=Ilex paraguariensis TaxID=185542 RepID=A0ABC8S7W0_9AQUA
MDAGNRYKMPRFPLSDRMLKRKNPCDDLDRFIPNRSAMDFDFAQFMLTGGKVEKENSASSSPSKDAYRKHLAEIFSMNRTRILAFKNKPPPSVDGVQEFSSLINWSSVTKRSRFIPQSSERTLDAPDILDDFYLNLLDWGGNNVLAIALGNSVYLWDASDGSTSELFAIDDDIGPVTSVRWAPDGQSLAVGLNNSHVQLWDSIASRLVCVCHDFVP